MMNVQLIAVLLVAVFFVGQSDAGWIRLRRIGRAIARVWKPACKFACPRGCGALTGGVGCKFVCRTACGRKKRAATDGDFHVTLLPRNFDFYDLDDDQFVIEGEIAKTLGHSFNDTGLSIAFNITDTDQDGRLTEKELFTSPVFVFADDTGAKPKSEKA